MSFFSRKKKNEIPDVAAPSPAPSHHSQSSQLPPPSYGSRGPSPAPSAGPGPQRPGYGYGQQQQQQDPSRSNLFAGGRSNSGPNPYAGTVPQGQPGQQAGPGQYGAGGYAAGGGSYNAGNGGGYGGYGGPGAGVGANASGGAAYLAATSGQQNGYGGGEQAQGEDEEVEGIKHMIKQTNQQSLASTRNALRTAREAEEVARATVDKLGEQTERFASTEQSVQMAKNYASRVDDNTSEIKQLNRSIFIPKVTFNKQKKRDAADQRILNRHLAEKAEREESLRDAARARNLADGALGRRPGYGPQYGNGEGDGEENKRGRNYAARSKYTFEADEEDQAVEDEIDDNLDEMTRLARSLNGLAVAQGNILEEHNRKIKGLTDIVDDTDERLIRGTSKMKRL